MGLVFFASIAIYGIVERSLAVGRHPGVASFYGNDQFIAGNLVEQ